MYSHSLPTVCTLLYDNNMHVVRLLIKAAFMKMMTLIVHTSKSLIVYPQTVLTSLMSAHLCDY